MSPARPSSPPTGVPPDPASRPGPLPRAAPHTAGPASAVLADVLPLTRGTTESPLVACLVLAPPGTDPADLLRTVRERLGPDLVAPAAVPPAGQTPRAPAPTPPPDFGLAVDVVARTVTVDGRSLDLTYLEYELLALLVAHPHRAFSRDQLVSRVWGYGPMGDRRTVDVHVARLRRKLGSPYRERIVTVHRVGYKYVVGSDA